MDDLEEIRARAAAASFGPWRRHGADLWIEGSATPVFVGRDGSSVTRQQADADAEFLAHARDDILALLSRLEDTTARASDNAAVSSAVDPRVARIGGVSYLHIPATDLGLAARFYEDVFGWTVSGHDTDHPSFQDGTGHVAGAWVEDQVISREPGLLPYIYVSDVDATLAQITAHGGEIVQAAYPEGSLRVATFRDPAGNVIGIWQDTTR